MKLQENSIRHANTSVNLYSDVDRDKESSCLTRDNDTSLDRRDNNAPIRNYKKKRKKTMKPINGIGTNVIHSGVYQTGVNDLYSKEKTSRKTGNDTNNLNARKFQRKQKTDELIERHDLRHGSKISKEISSEESAKNDQDRKIGKLQPASVSLNSSYSQGSSDITYMDKASIILFISIAFIASIMFSIRTSLTSCIKLIFQICMLTKVYELIKTAKFE